MHGTEKNPALVKDAVLCRCCRRGIVWRVCDTTGENIPMEAVIKSYVMTAGGYATVIDHGPNCIWIDHRPFCVRFK